MVARSKRGAASLPVDDDGDRRRDLDSAAPARRRRLGARDSGQTSVAAGLDVAAAEATVEGMADIPVPTMEGLADPDSPRSSDSRSAQSVDEEGDDDEGGEGESGGSRRHRRRSSAGVTDREMEAVIKVFCVHGEPNFSLPWQRKRQFSSSGSGFAIQGRRILTNAHCVDHATQVRVKRRGSDTKFVAKVLAVGHECDVAMLSVEDEAFWAGLEPVELGELPRLQDSIAVVGYPIGGDTMSVTSGVVSRIEVTSYVHGTSELLGIQVDAAINAGNSGGPAFGHDGQCVGIAFQSLKDSDAENISYIIPTPVVQHFIRDYETHGRYTGFPSLGLEWQKMESPVLREALGMASSQGGVLIRRVEPTSPLSKFISGGDVLLAFDGTAIGSDGTVPFRSGERIGFSYLVSQKYTGDPAELRVLQQRPVEAPLGVGAPAREADGAPIPKRAPRNGAAPAAAPSSPTVATYNVTLDPLSRLVPVHINNRPPSYFIVGGVVFTPVTVPLLRSEYGKEFDYDAPVKLLDKMMHGMADTPGQQIVVLSQVLASECNVGYEDLVNTQVAKVNGKTFKNLREFVALVEEGKEEEIVGGGAVAEKGTAGAKKGPKAAAAAAAAAAATAAATKGTHGPYLRFDLEYNQVVVLDRATAVAATPEILEQHCIPADRSRDLLDPAVTQGEEAGAEKPARASPTAPAPAPSPAPARGARGASGKPGATAKASGKLVRKAAIKAGVR